MFGILAVMLAVFYRRLQIHMKQDHYVKTWRHPQNRKWITFRNAVREGPSHGHRRHAQTIGEDLPCGFRVMRADKLKKTDRRTHHDTLPHSQGKVKRELITAIKSVDKFLLHSAVYEYLVYVTSGGYWQQGTTVHRTYRPTCHTVELVGLLSTRVLSSAPILHPAAGIFSFVSLSLSLSLCWFTLWTSRERERERASETKLKIPAAGCSIGAELPSHQYLASITAEIPNIINDTLSYFRHHVQCLSHYNVKTYSRTLTVYYGR